MTEPVKAGPPVFTINGEKCVTVGGAASWLGIEDYEVRNLVNYHKQLKAIKVSTATMITVDSLEEEGKRRGITVPLHGEVSR